MRSKALRWSAAAAVVGVFGLMASLASAKVVPTGSAQQTITTTVIFNIKHQKQLKQYIRATVTPGSAHYRDFLSVDEFVARFAPDTAQLNTVKHYFTSLGIKIDKVYADHLAMTVTGPASVVAGALNTRVQNYRETQPSHNPRSRRRFHRAQIKTRLPSALKAAGVLAVVGLSNQYKFKPMRVSTRQLTKSGKLKALKVNGKTMATGTPGQFTVADVAKIYDINPLYEEGVTGKGTTVGVATYADFLPRDAYTYWNFIGLNYKQDRISEVDIDGGAPFGAAAGSGETSLDVEQSGGLAPFANVVVYDAPNSSQGGIDMFYRIVSDNRVDTVSYSWGLPEIFYYPELNGGVDETSVMQSLNQAFMEAAAQGISVFAASGDAGAYDTTRALPVPSFSTPLTVDWPSSSPYVTAAGGTTLPITLVGRGGRCANSPYLIDVPAKRAWAWDYFAGYFRNCIQQSVFQAGVFSVGAGGGVSVYWARPWYQNGIAGVRASGQRNTLYDFAINPPFTYISLKVGYAGRNVPDISMDADPYSGFLLYSTADGGLLAGQGGTSFVAPQLNGITALINQRVGQRVGLLNAQLYDLLKTYGYGKNSPFNDITTGDNWYWLGQGGYDPATGVGTPDAARLAEVLAAQSSQ